MPRNAINAGIVDCVLPIPELARELVRLSLHPYLVAHGGSASSSDAALVGRILSLVQASVGVDFTEYKGRTLERRLARRMAIRRTDAIQDYLALVQREPEEIRALYEDLLIHVTSFFRDREVFQRLEAEILPDILQKKAPEAPIRIWVAGCATGEEVYSLGIALLELLNGSSRSVQIFGSDVSGSTIEKARAGIYSDGALGDISDERRRRYFVKTDRGYRINKAVRDLCVFVQHDLARDPPFSKLDLVSCRNVLIYFNHALQKRIVPTFHYALNQSGYLLLGRTESISGFGKLFAVVDKASKIFKRTAAPSALRFPVRSDAGPERIPSAEDVPGTARRTVSLAKHLDRVLLSRYAPPGVLINEKLEILQFRGQTGAFLQPAPGEPQSDVVKMARPGLLSPLRATIAEAKATMAPAGRSGVEIEQDGVTRTCNLVVFPFTGLPQSAESLFVVLFEDATAKAVAPGGPVEHRTSGTLEDARRIRTLEHELSATRDYLNSLIEEHGTTNDDLGSANEELVSGNEELQSMNEELETAKEELQSTNEELTTVNDELHSRNQEVTEVNSDLLNLLVTVDIPVIILDRERRIRRFTPKTRGILNLVPSDVGRPLDDIKLNIDALDLDRCVAAVIETMSMAESEVQDRQGRWYLMQIRPYKTTDNRIDGAILSFFDIDAMKRHVGEAQLARAEAERANRAKDLFLAVLGHELRTPLSILLLHAQMLRRGGAMDAARLERVGAAIERGTRMQVQLIDDLLDVSRIVAGKLNVELKVVDLCAVVRTALEGVSRAARKKNIRLEVALDETVGAVAGDVMRLAQVVSNLLTNAMKFTPDGGRVAVTVDSQDGFARLEVADTGAGIEAEFLPHVFNRFSQQDNSNTRIHGGLGLGLAIVRHLVEQHDGTVRAESAGPGKGATFCVRIPLMKVQQPSVEPLSSRRVDSDHPREYTQVPGLRVLVVDDDAATREAVAEMLREMGAEVKLAESAAQAIALVGSFRPEVLLCDIAMPGEDGYTFMRKLRALGVDDGGGTPALALTALGTEEDSRRALAAGFQLHLTKPVDIDGLSRAVVDLAERGARASAMRAEEKDVSRVSAEVSGFDAEELDDSRPVHAD
ncbi:MAG TPA: CheR family methyltransferase [Polyangiaceae bacterium]